MGIGARASDWHATKPGFSPGKWFGAIIGAALIYFIVLASIGSFFNGAYFS